MNYLKITAASMIAAAAMSTSAMAADLNVTGEVAEVCEVNVVSGSTSSINIAPGTTQAPIGAIEITCNAEGFDLTTDTANGFQLAGSGSALCTASTINYQLKFSVPFATQPFFSTATTVGTTTFDANFAAGQEVNVVINPSTGAAGLPGGCVLTDTVTFTVGPA